MAIFEKTKEKVSNYFGRLFDYKLDKAEKKRREKWWRSFRFRSEPGFCGNCNQFLRAREREKHVKNNHKMGNRAFECSICFMELESEYHSMNNHGTGNRDPGCSICNDELREHKVNRTQ